jgi:pyruvate formate-lyase activating enzyme-like uncharacterized protein
MCAKGSKMVVLITGKCVANCYYCPLSFHKAGTDKIFADEWELKNEGDTDTLLREAEAINASGAGITGGDPLLVWKRTQTYVTFLKKAFGDTFHIHLYTSGLKNANRLPEIVTAGLDEVRFHPMPNTWSKMEESPLKKIIQKMVKTSVDVAVEIPVIPKKEKEILSLISWAEKTGIQWINLNELEYSERNVRAFTTRGYQIKSDVSAAVKGSEASARKIISMVEQKGVDVGVHYCSVSFKDGVQLKNILKRRAHNIAQPYDVITKDGTLLKGVIEQSGISFQQTLALLTETFHVPSQLCSIDLEKRRIEIAAWMLEKIAVNLVSHGYRCYIVEEYPTADRLEVERIPMPSL